MLPAAVVVASAWLTALLPPDLVRDDARASRDYDDQVFAWIDGRWDLPYGGSSFERFRVDGRYYMYFAPTPALLRLPFAELLTKFPAKAGFLSVFLAVALGLWAALRTFEEVSGEPPGTVAMVALAGLPLVIASRFAIYHEAIAWASAFALLATLQALRYQRSPSLATLASVAASAWLAAFARETWLLGMVALMGALGAAALTRAQGPPPRFHRLRSLKSWLGLPDVDHPARHAGLAWGAAGLLLFSEAAIHRAKFGEWGFVPPLERHVVYAADPARLARLGHGHFHLVNLRTGVYNYLSPTSARWAPDFPWIHPVAALRVFPEARIDQFEDFMGLPHVAGVLMLSAGAGIVAAARNRARRDVLPVLAATAMTASTCFFTIGFCGRYLYDFFPALVVGGALGWATLGRVRTGWVRAAVVLLTLYNFAASAALAMTIQQFAGPLPRRPQMQRVADRIDRAILRPVARLGDRTCPMPGARRIVFRLRAAARPLDRDDPVVVTGAAGQANFVSLRRFPDGTAAFGFRSWGAPEVFGRRFPIDGAWHDLEVSFDVPGIVRVTQDGSVMLAHHPLYEVLGQPIWLGHNPVGGPALAARFAGEIDCLR